MNRDRLIKLSTSVAMFFILLLIYWTFTFISITVFDFKIFKENMTETFFMSVFAILAVLSGALIINLILNLSKISEALAERAGTAPSKESGTHKRVVWGLLALFPVIFLFLYLGNLASSAKKRNRLESAAAMAVETNRSDIEKMGQYRFDLDYIQTTESVLARITKEEKFFPSATILVPDQIDGHPTILEFESWRYHDKDNAPTKVQFIRKCTPEERQYLNAVFRSAEFKPRFSAYKGTYELFYPIKTARGVIVLFLSEHGNYGKIGS